MIVPLALLSLITALLTAIALTVAVDEWKSSRAEARFFAFLSGVYLLCFFLSVYAIITT